MDNLNLHSCYIGKNGLQIGHTNNNHKGTIRLNKNNNILEYSDGIEWINCVKNVNRCDRIIYSKNESDQCDLDSIIFGNNKNINKSIIFGSNNNCKNTIIFGNNTKCDNDTLIIGNNLYTSGTNSIFIGNNTESEGNNSITISSNSSIHNIDNNIIIGNDNTIDNTSKSIYLSTKIYKSNSIGDTFLGYQVGYHPPNISILSEYETENENDHENDHEMVVSLPKDETYNTIIGCNSGYQLAGVENTIIGCNSGYRVNNNNVYIGYQSGLSKSNSNSYNCVIGGHNNFHDSYTKNILIGFNAGINSKNDNILIGYETQSNGINNINIGFKTGNMNDNNIFIGCKSGEISYGKNTTSIGSLSSQYSHGSNSTFGCKNGILLVNNNTSIGANTAVSNNGTNNTLVGYNIGNQNSNDNIIIGSNSGNLLEGDKNILIGYNCGDENISNITKSICIGCYSGNNITGDFIISNKYNNYLLCRNNDILDINGSLNLNSVIIKDLDNTLSISSKTEIDGICFNKTKLSVSNIKLNNITYINNNYYDVVNSDTMIIIQYPDCTLNLPNITEDILGKFFYLKQLNIEPSTVHSKENQTINGNNYVKLKYQNSCILLVPIDINNWHMTILFSGDNDIRYSNILQS